MIGNVLHFYESKQSKSNFFKINYTHTGIGGYLNGKETNDNRLI